MLQSDSRSRFSWLERAALVPACALLFATPAARPLAAADAPYEIPVMLPLTGPAAFLGKTSKDTLVSFEAQIDKSGGVNGRPVTFTYYDDQSNPQQAVQLASMLAAKSVPGFIGPAFTATCKAVAPMLGSGPVSYCLSPGVSPAPGSYVFSGGASSKDLAKIIYRYALQRGWKRLATITSTDATGQDAEAHTRELLALPEFKDEQLVAAEHFNDNDIDVSAQVARIKAANPQVLVVWANGSPFGTVVRSLNQNGADLPVVTSSGNLSTEELSAFAAYLPRELYFEASPTLLLIAANGAMRQAQQAMLGAGAPNLSATAATWDAAMFFVEALRAYGFGLTATQLRDYIDSRTNVAGAGGIYDFRAIPQRGLTENDLVMMRWDAATKKLIQVSELGGKPK